MQEFNIAYCCTFRDGMGATVEDCYYCANIEAAYKKAIADIHNQLWCESVFFETFTHKIRFDLDNFEGVSGRLSITYKPVGITQSRHVADFGQALPLGEVDHANRKVWTACYNELSRLWSSNGSIKKMFMTIADVSHENIDDFMQQYCNMGDRQRAIIRKHYGDHERAISARYTEHIPMWCNQFFGGFYRYEFDPDYTPPKGEVECDFPF